MRTLGHSKLWPRLIREGFQEHSLREGPSVGMSVTCSILITPGSPHAGILAVDREGSGAWTCHLVFPLCSPLAYPFTQG